MPWDAIQEQPTRKVVERSMCYSKSEGGARCSSHTRVALDKAATAYSNHLLANSDDDAESQRLRDVVRQKQFEHATTPAGSAEMEGDIARQQEHVDSLTPHREPQGPGTAEKPYRFPDTSYQQTEEYQAAVTSLRNTERTFRSARAVRSAQEAARDRSKEVRDGHVGDQTAKALADEPTNPAQNVAVEDYNGTWHRSTIIGAIAVDEPFTEVDNSYETAAWSTTHEVQPGIYPVHLTDKGDLSYSFDTTVTNQHMPPLFGGVPMGEGPKDKVGKGSQTHHHSYAFQAPMAYTPGVRFGGGSLVLRQGVDLDYVTSNRDGATTARAHFTITGAADTEPQPNEARRRRLA